MITPVQPSDAIAGIDPELTHQVAEFIEQYRIALDELAMWWNICRLNKSYSSSFIATN